METETIILVVVFLIWYLVGLISFIYDFTLDFDITLKDLVPMILISFGGLITLLIILEDRFDYKFKNTILIKKRKS